MAEPSADSTRRPRGKGTVVVDTRKADDHSYAIRYRAGGKRWFVQVGRESDGMSKSKAEQELEETLTLIKRGVWKPPAEPVIEVPKTDPTFHVFASAWLEKKKPELGERTYDDYLWALKYHLLPFFQGHRLTQITKQEVDAYKTYKLREATLAPNTINKTLTRLSQILDEAVEYDLIAANPASGKRRRVKSTRPRRPWVEPEQLPSLLKAAEGYLAGRGRPLLSVLAGAGLRIDEALSLERRDVNILRATLTVRQSKTDAGIRTVDLTPALRDELALWLDRSPFKQPTDLVFPTLKGKKDNRQNVRRRLLVVAVAKADERLVSLGIEPIGAVGLHGLRRTYASLRCVVGDDVAYTSAQIGHTDAEFTLKTYTFAVSRRERLIGHELAEFNAAVEWAQRAATGSNAVSMPETTKVESAA